MHVVCNGVRGSLIPRPSRALLSEPHIIMLPLNHKRKSRVQRSCMHTVKKVKQETAWEQDQIRGLTSKQRVQQTRPLWTQLQIWKPYIHNSDVDMLTFCLQLLYKVLETWPTSVYNAKAILCAVEVLTPQVYSTILCMTCQVHMSDVDCRGF